MGVASSSIVAEGLVLRLQVAAVRLVRQQHELGPRGSQVEGEPRLGGHDDQIDADGQLVQGQPERLTDDPLEPVALNRAGPDPTPDGEAQAGPLRAVGDRDDDQGGRPRPSAAAPSPVKVRLAADPGPGGESLLIWWNVAPRR